MHPRRFLFAWCGLAAAALAAACGGEGSGPIFRPTPRDEIAVLVGAGDIGECGPTSAAEATARLLDRIEGTVITLGDNAYPAGRDEDFRFCYEPTWGRHKGRTRPSPGNHDYESPGAAPYFVYFGANAGPTGLGYYRYNAGSWAVFSLNSNVPAGRGSPQLLWLQDELSSSPGRCTIAYFHHPPYSSGGHGNSEWMHDLWRELYAAGADIVLAAHEHNYERMGAMNGEGRADPGRGIRQFIVGTGGAQLVPSVRAWPTSEFRTTQHGVLKLTLSTGRYQWEFIQTSGAIADSGFDVCH